MNRYASSRGANMVLLQEDTTSVIGTMHKQLLQIAMPLEPKQSLIVTYTTTNDMQITPRLGNSPRVCEKEQRVEWLNCKGLIDNHRGSMYNS